MLPTSLLKPWYLQRPKALWRRLFLKRPKELTLKKVDMAWGGSLEFDVAGSIGWSALTTGVVDLALSEILCHLIERGTSVLDVGANVGGITCLMARLAGSQGCVEAFEPHPAIYERLDRNCKLNLGPLQSAVVLRKMAASDSQGEAILAENPNAASDGQASLETLEGGLINFRVKKERLDDILTEDRYPVMKLDVKGHELPVLLGSGKYFTEKKVENLFFEDHIGKNSPVCDFLRKCGYHLYSFGWTLGGVRVEPINVANLNNRFEAPNYWASSKPIRQKYFPGWRCLSVVNP